MSYQNITLLFTVCGLISTLLIHPTWGHEVKKNGPVLTQTNVPSRPAKLEEIQFFHGHGGPFVMLGLRMGEDAVLNHGFPKYFGIRVVAECPENPPHACLIDGLQVGCGTTYGKKNIEHRPADQIKVTITNEKTNEILIYTIKESILKQMAEWEKAKVDVEERGIRLFNMKPEELLDIEKKNP